MRRAAFSLIELVLSIIVIAISLMSVPMLIGESQKSNQYSFIQESVMAARTKLGNILTFPWDQNSTVIENGAITAVVVVRTNGDNNLSKLAGIPYRRGHIRDSKRRWYDINSSWASPIAGDNNITDIGDFNGSSTSVTLTGGSGTEGDFDYLDKNDLNITTRVYFLEDNLTSPQSYKDSKTINFVFDTSRTTSNTPVTTTNIKMIELSVESAYSDTPFVLRAFSSNIGGISALHSEVK